MRIVQVCYGWTPRKTARNGGELRYWQDLASLVALGHEVHLVVCQAISGTEAREPDVERLPATITYVRAPDKAMTRLDAWRALLPGEASLRLHLRYPGQLRPLVADIVRRLQPDMVWANWLATMALLPAGLPTVYAHQDFLYKVLTVRAATQLRRDHWRDRWRTRWLRRAELALCAAADHVVCVSDSERAQLAALGRRCTYIPIVGPTIAGSSAPTGNGPRVFFFGTWASTAMRSGARHFREVVWPTFGKREPPVEWHQVGTPEPQESADWRWVEQRFVCHGFVDDLGGVFRIGDACLVPYTEDTGFRTKFVTAAAHGLVNIGYDTAFRCAPEFTPGMDCLVATTPAELVAMLHEYANDRGLRRRLGAASRALYEAAFSFEAQLPKYERALLGAVATGATAVGKWLHL